MATMNRSPDTGVNSNYFAFQFPRDVTARIIIEIKEATGGKRGVESHVIYSSAEDKDYPQLVNVMTRAAGSIMEHNFSDGKDETRTPLELSERLEELKKLVRTFDKDKGHKITSRLLGRAKAEMFQKEDRIRERTTSEKRALEEILRWHIEQALNG